MAAGCTHLGRGVPWRCPAAHDGQDVAAKQHFDDAYPPVVEAATELRNARARGSVRQRAGKWMPVPGTYRFFKRLAVINAEAVRGSHGKAAIVLQ